MVVKDLVRAEARDLAVWQESRMSRRVRSRRGGCGRDGVAAAAPALRCFLG